MAPKKKIPVAPIDDPLGDTPDTTPTLGLDEKLDCCIQQIHALSTLVAALAEAIYSSNAKASKPTIKTYP